MKTFTCLSLAFVLAALVAMISVRSSPSSARAERSDSQLQPAQALLAAAAPPNAGHRLVHTIRGQKVGTATSSGQAIGAQRRLLVTLPAIDRE
jgi:hypothetical protein